MRPDPATTVSHRAWLAAALRGERPVWHGDATAADELLACAVKEGVAALVHANGASNLLPASIAAEFAAFERGRVVASLPDHAELVRVVRALAEARVPTLLLKGSALGYWLYPSAHLRPRVDTDLLFRDRASVELGKAALQPLGYAATDALAGVTTGYELSLHRVDANGQTHHIDAHWKLANLAIFSDALSWDELDAAVIALPAIDPVARGLGPVHALLHACMHRIANLPAEPGSNAHGDRLLWLYDIDLLARRFASEDFESLHRIAIERGIAGTCVDGLRQAQAAFATPLPEDLLRSLEDAARSEAFDIGKANLRWYQEWRNLRAITPRQRLAWAREKLFPDADYMRGQYPARGAAGLAWAYLRRIGHGLRIALRRRG
ncbi:MAG TPA: nucleotidyltransferase family protein [Xanthomonadaceae bacterium]|jgi:hypothetical protein